MFFGLKILKRQILFAMKHIRKFLVIILFSFLALIFTATGYYFSVTAGINLSPEKLVLSEKNIVLFDGKNAEIKNLSSNFVGKTVAYREIPEKTRLAFVDTEDKRFFSHKGFDIKRIVKSIYNNLKAHSFKQGASTISQQLIKNTHLSQEKTLSRKLKEWKLTKQLEKKYSKEEILEKYLSVIYFGHDCFGLKSAANFYFGKTPEELDLADSAILAGLVKSPNNYSPFKNQKNCLLRKESVLNAMLRNGDITQAEKRDAMEKPLPLTPNAQGRNNGYMHFVFDEFTALSEKYEFTVGGNIEIYTYLDPTLQNYMEELTVNYKETDISACVLDAQAKGFKACISTVGEIQRLPGSLLKPLLVYAPALEEDFISPATPILDEKVNYNGYSPSNYDGLFHGYVSARECVAKSLNIPAIKLLESFGAEKGAHYLEKLGLPIEKEDISLALALGGMKKGFSLQKLVNAYATFTQNGNFNESGFISKIKIDGKSVYNKTIKEKRVFSKETSYLMTDILKTTAQTGTAKKLRSFPFEIAAKTGTVGTEKGNTDAYAVSYTTKDVAGIWLGNADNTFIDHTGGGLPCNFLLKINERLQENYQALGKQIPSFTTPEGVVRVTLDKTSYYDTHTLSLADELSPIEYRFTELFKKQAIPTKKSDFFSNPAIIPPSLRFEDGCVYISFEKNLPEFYQYKIDRYDYVTHTTIYLGEYITEFCDIELEKDKNYVYTVTPIYKNRTGKEIVLPSVSTKTTPTLPFDEKAILEKNWWEE